MPKPGSLPLERTFEQKLTDILWMQGAASLEETADRVLELIGYHETRHKVRLTEDSWVLEHPIRERFDGSLLDCPVNEKLSEYPPDAILGLGHLHERYWVSFPTPDSVIWESISE